MKDIQYKIISVGIFRAKISVCLNEVQCRKFLSFKASFDIVT